MWIFRLTIICRVLRWLYSDGSFPSRQLICTYRGPIILLTVIMVYAAKGGSVNVDSLRTARWRWWTAIVSGRCWYDSASRCDVSATGYSDSDGGTQKITNRSTQGTTRCSGVRGSAGSDYCRISVRDDILYRPAYSGLGQVAVSRVRSASVHDDISIVRLASFLAAGKTLFSRWSAVYISAMLRALVPC